MPLTASAARIALVGDHDPKVLAHTAIPIALDLAARSTGVRVSSEWVATDRIAGAARLAGFDAIWCVPGSPYRSMEGALRAIRWARETGHPFLGTCGGFQHALVEYARAVLGWADADHAETAQGGGRLVVVPLACDLVEVRSAVHFRPASRLAAAYGALDSVEGYRCRYGLGPEMRAAIDAGPLRIAAEDDVGDVRAVELDGHPFFVATLFQPERAALEGRVPPIVAAFVQAVATRSAEAAPLATG